MSGTPNRQKVRVVEHLIEGFINQISISNPKMFYLSLHNCLPEISIYQREKPHKLKMCLLIKSYHKNNSLQGNFFNLF